MLYRAKLVSLFIKKGMFIIMEKKYIVGIDLGGTKIAGALSDKKGNILYKKTIDTLWLS